MLQLHPPFSFSESPIWSKNEKGGVGGYAESGRLWYPCYVVLWLKQHKYKLYNHIFSSIRETRQFISSYSERVHLPLDSSIMLSPISDLC